MSLPLDSDSKREVREANSSRWRVISQQSTIKMIIIIIIKMAEQLSGKCMRFEIPDDVSTVYFIVCRGK